MQQSPSLQGLGPSHLGQLLAEPEVLLAEFTKGLRPLSTTVLLFGPLLAKLGPQGFHISLQFHSSGLPLSTPGCQSSTKLMILLLQPLCGGGKRSHLRLEQTRRQRWGVGVGQTPRASVKEVSLYKADRKAKSTSVRGRKSEMKPRES